MNPVLLKVLALISSITPLKTVEEGAEKLMNGIAKMIEDHWENSVQITTLKEALKTNASKVGAALVASTESAASDLVDKIAPAIEADAKVLSDSLSARISALEGALHAHVASTAASLEALQNKNSARSSARSRARSSASAISSASSSAR